MTMRNSLREFFGPQLNEGDPLFTAPPEVPVEPEPDLGALDAPPEPDLGMTQDVSPLDQASFTEFHGKGASALAKYNVPGLDPVALDGFTSALDQAAQGMYATVMDPASRQKFETEYAKIAGDFSVDLTKTLEKLLKLQQMGVQQQPAAPVAPMI